MKLNNFLTSQMNKPMLRFNYIETQLFSIITSDFKTKFQQSCYHSFIYAFVPFLNFKLPWHKFTENYFTFCLFLKFLPHTLWAGASQKSAQRHNLTAKDNFNAFKESGTQFCPVTITQNVVAPALKWSQIWSKFFTGIRKCFQFKILWKGKFLRKLLKFLYHGESFHISSYAW